MSLRIGSVAVLMLFATTAHASIIEDTTTQVHPALTYQEDAHVPGDAPDQCADVDRDRLIVVDGEAVPAMLVEIDDESDVFLSPTQDFIGDRLAIQVTPNVPVTIQQLGMDVLAADCSYSVFDPEAPPYQSISPEPDEGEKIVFADLSGDCKNSKDYWKFQISQEQPQEIFIEWTNGEWERESFIDSNNGKGNYVTFANTGYSIRTAEAVVSGSWDGHFRLVQRPCDVVDGGAEPVERFAPAPTKDGLSGEWDAREEEYVVHVFMTAGIQEGIEEEVDELLGTEPSLVTTKDCHRDLCRGQMDYDVAIF